MPIPHPSLFLFLSLYIYIYLSVNLFIYLHHHYLKGDLHVNVCPIGDYLATTAADLHASEQAEVDTFPDPGPGWHLYVWGKKNGESVTKNAS